MTQQTGRYAEESFVVQVPAGHDDAPQVRGTERHARVAIGDDRESVGEGPARTENAHLERTADQDGGGQRRNHAAGQRCRQPPAGDADDEQDRHSDDELGFIKTAQAAGAAGSGRRRGERTAMVTAPSRAAIET